jgi:hypothetical protein
MNQGENEYDDGNRHHRRQQIEEDAQALPAFALWIMEDCFCHE